MRAKEFTKSGRKAKAMYYDPNTDTYRVDGVVDLPTLDEPKDIQTVPLSKDIVKQIEVPSDGEPNIDFTLKRELNKIMDELSAKERQIIHMRYWKDMTLAEVAREMNVSPERIRQVEYKAIRKLKLSAAKHQDSDIELYAQESINESIKLTDDERKEHIQKFIKWTIKLLNIQKPYPRIILSNDTEKAQKGHHTGVHTNEDDTIWVYTGNRNLVDILRTVMHELTHEKQMQLDMIDSGDSYPGSPVEMLADMVAGKYIKVWGKKHPEIFE